MFRKCIRLFALTAACLFTGVAAVRLGFDLYEAAFTREEVLLLVGILIAALIMFLVWAVTDAPEVAAVGASGGKSTPGTRFATPVTEPICMTCEFWYGERAPDPKSRNVIARSSKSPGTCIHSGSRYKAAKKAATPRCESYEIWRLLA
ncbi:hypothetical protein LPW11_01915 [Geomonas sp. RF6]|uniref:hypothetical protein n=1 Tax=Geomonas sp. RF6 TaxID=2897342 RepID=UPI001E378B33|nr:hypothetical protein [Geomonas sp. RF6]UFS70953.1 hypothetical protein LPW11_01915 [Geomonas sp. RF6]